MTSDLLDMGRRRYLAGRGDIDAMKQVREHDEQRRVEREHADADVAPLPVVEQVPTTSNPVSTFTDPELVSTVLAELGLSQEDRVFLTGSTVEELRVQGQAVAALKVPAAPEVPAFAANPGQAAGNAEPPARSGMDAGRELYRDRNPR